jgi:hypothetical protein
MVLAWLKDFFGGRAASPSLAPSRPGDVAAALSDGRRPAVALLRDFPVRHPTLARSWLGGCPMAPSSFEWPRHRRADGVSVPLTFVAQVDCGDLPDFADRALLPRDGALLFFIGFGDEVAAVIHQAGPTQDWVQHRAPHDAPPVLGDGACDAFAWIAYTTDAAQRLPRAFIQWPIRLAAIETFRPNPFDGSGDVEAEAEYERRSVASGQASIVAAAGEVPDWRDLGPGMKAQDITAWRPFDGFPQSWQAIEWAAGAMLYELVVLSGWGKRPLSEAWKRVEAQAHQWVAEARCRDGMTAPSTADVERFWQWLDAIAARPVGAGENRLRNRPFQLVNRALESIASFAAEASLVHSREAAARVPRTAVERLRARHHPLRRSPEHGYIDVQLQHQMLGQPLLIQDPEYAADHLLLLQLVYDPAMSWLFGDVGAYQFWITEQDLRAGRFDQAKLTFESH